MILKVGLSLTVCFFSLQSSASVETRGGGSVEAAEFADLSREAIQRGLLQSPIKILGENFDFVELSKKFKSSSVNVSDSPLTLRGNRVSIINDWKANSILIDAKRWQAFKLTDKKRLVLHELIGLLKGPILDAAYEYSDLIDRITASVDLLSHSANFECFDIRGDRSYVINETGFGVLCAVDSLRCKSIGVPMRQYRTDGRRESFQFAAGFDRSLTEGSLRSVAKCEIKESLDEGGTHYELKATLRGAVAVYGEDKIKACCELKARNN